MAMGYFYKFWIKFLIYILWNPQCQKKEEVNTQTNQFLDKKNKKIIHRLFESLTKRILL